MGHHCRGIHRPSGMREALMARRNSTGFCYHGPAHQPRLLMKSSTSPYGGTHIAAARAARF